MDTIGPIDTATVRRLAARNGLDLTAERATDLVAPLQLLLAADEEIKRLALGTLPAVGLPWREADAQPD